MFEEVLLLWSDFVTLISAICFSKGLNETAFYTLVPFFFTINIILPQPHQLLQLSLEHRDSFFSSSHFLYFTFFPILLCFESEILLQFKWKKGKRYTLEYHMPCTMGVRKIPQDFQQSNFSQQQNFYPNFWPSLQIVNIDQQENFSAEYCNWKSLRAAISIYIVAIRESQAM